MYFHSNCTILKYLFNNSSVRISRIGNWNIFSWFHIHLGQSFLQLGHISHHDGNVRHNQVIIRVHTRSAFDQVKINVTKGQPSSMPEKNNDFWSLFCLDICTVLLWYLPIKIGSHNLLHTNDIRIKGQRPSNIFNNQGHMVHWSPKAGHASFKAFIRHGWWCLRKWSVYLNLESSLYVPEVTLQGEWNRNGLYSNSRTVT